MDKIEFLLMLAQDLRADGDTLSAETRERYSAHYQRACELSVMIDKAKELTDREKQRFEPRPVQQLQPGGPNPNTQHGGLRQESLKKLAEGGS